MEYAQHSIKLLSVLGYALPTMIAQVLLLDAPSVALLIYAVLKSTLVKVGAHVLAVTKAYDKLWAAASLQYVKTLSFP
jgi:hypothetical protein